MGGELDQIGRLQEIASRETSSEPNVCARLISRKNSSVVSSGARMPVVRSMYRRTMLVSST